MLPWARETIGLSARFCLCIKIFRRILTENAQQYVALLEGFFMGIALQARHPNENLENNLQLESFSVSSVCSVDYSVATLEILEEIFFKEWPEARNYSITYESKSLNYNL